jgi:anti-anti-sigma factor
VGPRRSRVALAAAIGTPALPHPFVVPTPAEDASRKVSQLRDPGEGPAPHPALPAANPLILAVDESDSTLRLRLTGEFDGAGVGSVEHALNRLTEASAPNRVVFDLRGLVFLGAAGLRTILEADARGRAEAFEVVVVRPRGMANRVFTLTPAGKRLSIVDAPQAA